MDENQNVENLEFQKAENRKLKKTFAGDNPFYLGVRDDLNKIGPGMCLAKWTQVTMHLQLGTHIPATTLKLTQFHHLKLKETHRLFTIHLIKKEKEKRC